MKQEISCIKKKFGSDQSDQQPKSLASLSSFYSREFRIADRYRR